ncbi:MAG: response regulator, partial [Gemmatimonadetes bacterium]|nr:response regulator [Gemmatimonadota bacterium]
MATASGVREMAAPPVRTLIVDDDRNARGYLRGLLGRFDEVDVVGEATDGRAAKREIERLRPDLVFLDVEMPGLDGFDVLEKLGPGTPHVIFVSGYDR